MRKHKIAFSKSCFACRNRAAVSTKQRCVSFFHRLNYWLRIFQITDYSHKWSSGKGVGSRKTKQSARKWATAPSRILLYLGCIKYYSDCYFTCLRKPQNFKVNKENKLLACAIARVRFILFTGLFAVPLRRIWPFPALYRFMTLQSG